MSSDKSVRDLENMELEHYKKIIISAFSKNGISVSVEKQEKGEILLSVDGTTVTIEIGG